MINNFYSIVNKISFERENLLPSEWSEKHRKLTSDVSTLQGPFNYNVTPYLREIIDTLSPYHPAKIVSVMKGAQIGYTEGVIVNGIAWIIANNPANIMSLSANDTLSKEMVESRLDQAISSCDIRHLIRPNTIRKSNQRTGDTSQYKEFAGGRLFAGGLKSIDKLGKQRSLTYGFFDDWDSCEINDKGQGNIFSLIQQRFNSSSNVMKQFYISTPENDPSNIEQIYMKGDRRIWTVPCPCCGDYIEIVWSVIIDGERYGIVYETEENGKLIPSTVAYRCQSCGNTFKEKYKYEINKLGVWKPTATPSQEGYYSYHINALVAAPHMYGWTHYANQFCEINGSKAKLKVFNNLVLGIPWREQSKTVESHKLMRNCRNYQINEIPKKLSLADGNGMIIMLTCAVDLNGTVDDARMDYEVVAHAENGSSYSIDHGSIGTYQPKLKKEGRIQWTYQEKKHNNVWDFLWTNIINKVYTCDDGSEMKILITGIDAGYYDMYVYPFVQLHSNCVIAIKGKGKDKNTTPAFSKDVPAFKISRERNDLFIIESDKIKDEISERIDIFWNKEVEIYQQSGFINFPTPSDGKYLHESYFKQYEAENKLLKKNDDGEVIGWEWVRKQGSHNHFFDCACYNHVLKNIYSWMYCKNSGIKNGNYFDFVKLVKTLLAS